MLFAQFLLLGAHKFHIPVPPFWEHDTVLQ